MSVVPPYILFCARRDPTTFMSQAENQVRSSGLRMEPAVFRIKTIYRNYRRARFIEFDRTVSASPPFSSLHHPRPTFFSGGGNAQRCLIRGEKLSIRICMASGPYILCPISSTPPSLKSFYPFFLLPLFFSRP